jgi:hypothetical protein
MMLSRRRLFLNAVAAQRGLAILPPPITTVVASAVGASPGPFGGRRGGTVAGSVAEGWGT